MVAGVAEQLVYSVELRTVVKIFMGILTQVEVTYN